VTGVLKSVNYKPSPILSGGPEVPLLLTFSCPQKWARDKMKEFIEDFYSFDFTGIQCDTDNSSSDEDFEIDLDLTTSTMADNEEGDEAGEEKKRAPLYLIMN